MKSLHLVATLGLTLAALAGCSQTRTVDDREAGTMGLTVWQSAKKVNVNETVTFEATDKNTLGRNAKLNWEATGGKLWSTDSSNRVVQVQYMTPGVYSVTATLTADNQQPMRETRTVDVRPITP
jgi:hypothetical protein